MTNRAILGSNGSVTTALCGGKHNFDWREANVRRAADWETYLKRLN